MEGTGVGRPPQSIFPSTSYTWSLVGVMDVDVLERVGSIECHAHQCLYCIDCSTGNAWHACWFEGCLGMHAHWRDEAQEAEVAWQGVFCAHAQKLSEVSKQYVQNAHA